MPPSSRVAPSAVPRGVYVRAEIGYGLQTWELVDPRGLNLLLYKALASRPPQMAAEKDISDALDSAIGLVCCWVTTGLSRNYLGHLGQRAVSFRRVAVVVDSWWSVPLMAKHAKRAYAASAAQTFVRNEEGAIQWL